MEDPLNLIQVMLAKGYDEGLHAMASPRKSERRTDWHE
jgi:hypothetical protein